MTPVEIDALLKRVDNLEKMTVRIETILKKGQCFEEIKLALEQALDNKSRDLKLNIIIILLVIGVVTGIFAIFSLYQLAV